MKIDLDKKDYFWLFSMLVTIIGLLLFFLNPPSSKPPQNLLSVEYHRIKAGPSTPLLFKMMEGAFLEYSPAFSSDNDKQYFVVDDRENQFGVVTSKFQEIWDRWPFKEYKPINTLFWQQVSGNQENNNFIGALNSMSISKKFTKLKQYAKNIICFHYFSSLNEDGIGWIYDSVSEYIYNQDNEKLCNLIAYDPYDFYYTVVTLENNTEKIINDLRLDYEEKSTYLKAKDVLFHDSYDFCVKKKIRDWDVQQKCERDYQIQYIQKLMRLNVMVDDVVKTKSGSISVLNPGDKIILLLNAYSPNKNGLPEQVLFRDLNLFKISYRVEGFKFEDERIKPLGVDRLGIINTPSGGIGGQ